MEKTATLGGRLVKLSPLPFDHRADVVAANSDHAEDGLATRQYIYFAALGLSLPNTLQPRPGYSGKPSDLMAYGRRVYVSLRDAGCAHKEVFKAAVDVFLAASADIYPTVQEATDRADFSEAGEEPATSSPSTFPSSTETTPAGFTG